MSGFQARLLHFAVRALAATWRIEVAGAEHVTSARIAGGRVIYALWHAAMVPLLWLHRGERVTLLVSGHGDGGLLAAAAAPWGYRVVRGSSTRGGAAAYRRVLTTLAGEESVAVTPDGPRGPARIAKAGVVAAAQHSGVPIVPVAMHATRSWCARSWDRLAVPLPFARVRVVYGRPRTIPPGRVARGAAQRALTSELNTLTEQACAG